MRLIENAKLIWAAAPKNYTGAAMADKYVSLKNYAHLTIVISTGAWAAGTAAVTLTQATAIAGTGAKALAIPNHWHDETLDGTLVKVATVSNTFNLTTANKMYVIEVEANSLDLANDFDNVTLAVASPGANADFYQVDYILSEPRYAADTPPSAVLD